MRKCTKKAIDAFLTGKSVETRNMSVSNGVLCLWGSFIIKDVYEHWVLSPCGYTTQTTLDRLNSFLTIVGVDYEARFRIRKGILYLGNSEFNPYHEIRVNKTTKEIEYDPNQ